MKSKTYIIAWDKAIDNCLDIYSQLSNAKIPHIFYNVSSKSFDYETWKLSEDLRYYGHFYNALKDFVHSDFDIFVFNAGDAYYTDYADFTEKIEQLFKSDEEVWAYAPSIKVDEFSDINLQNSTKHNELYLTCMTNGIYFALSRELATIMYKYMDWAVLNQHIKFKTMMSGWGLDVIFCGIAMYNNKKIYRDKIVFLHPQGSGYAGSIASIEYQTVLNSFLEYCAQIDYNPEKLRKLFEKIIQSPHKNATGSLDINDYYPQLSTEV